MFSAISLWMIPVLVLGIVIYGFSKKVDLYDTFVDGAKESFELIFNMFPCLLAMILGVNLFVKSDFITFLLSTVEPFFHWMGIPVEVVPMAIMRPISGTSSLALLNNLLQTFGPDGLIGRLASVIQGSTDTTFYILTLYFGVVGIKKIRYALWAGLAADLIGILASVFLVQWLF